MPQLKQMVGKEIFLSFDEDDNDAYLSEIYVTEELMELVGHMCSLSPQLDPTTKILHGVLTKAHTIPENLRGKDAFIIMENVDNDKHALILDTEAVSSKELAKEVNDAFLERAQYERELGIEKIYILYGYEITTVLSINDEEIDEEIIDVCKKIAKDANNISVECADEK